MHGCRGRAWLLAGGMHGKGGHAWDTTTKLLTERQYPESDKQSFAQLKGIISVNHGKICDLVLLYLHTKFISGVFFLW